MRISGMSIATMRNLAKYGRSTSQYVRHERIDSNALLAIEWLRVLCRRGERFCLPLNYLQSAKSGSELS